MSYMADKKAAREAGREKGKLYRNYMLNSVSGLEVGVGVAAGAIIGLWLDKKFGWSPWGVIGGVIAGCIHSVRVLYSLYLKSQREEEREQAERDQAATNASNESSNGV